MRFSKIFSIALIAIFTTLLQAGYKVDFELDVSDWQDKPKSVNLAGNFNGWNKDATPMTRSGDSGWKVTLDLPEGVTQYKFVIDKERWINDAKSDKSLDTDDNFGGKNSGKIVGPDARKFPSPLPDSINPSGLIHNPATMEDLNIVSNSEVRVRMRTQSDDVQQVNLLNTTDNSTTPLHRISSRMGFDFHGGSVECRQSIIKYVFEIKDGKQTIYLSQAGASADVKEATNKPFNAEVKTSFVTPDWAKHAVWYQIFPERFRNGDPSNDPNSHVYERLVPWKGKWYSALPGEYPGDENFYQGKGNVWNRRYGGDIQGLREKLPYLRKLGVTAIYLNPIFEAESMHKYDTSDYRHIDDNFGVKGDNPLAYNIKAGDDPARFPTTQKIPLADETDDPSTWKWSASDKLFLDFVADAHQQGFKIVLDGVFNHVGRDHPFFQDVLKKGKNSKYADWFDITDWGNPANWREHADPMLVHGKPGGIQWKAWDQESGSLPNFKKDPVKGLAPGPYAHVMAITKRWLAPDGDPSKGIDGFRLDVANDIPSGFWRDWRKVVKQTKPDAYISGEIWGNAQVWLGGDQFDAVMNYPFASIAQEFFVNQQKAISPSQFVSRLADLVYQYPEQASAVQMNLFDSHDTDRFASMFVNPDVPYDGSNRIQDNGPKYNPRKPNETERKRMMQAVVAQMTYFGAPMIYYGNEAGMWSADDPSNRQPMIWEDLGQYDDPEVKFDKALFDHYRLLIAVRQALPALQTGDFYPVKTDDTLGVAVYGRTLNGNTVYVALNRSAEDRSISFKVNPADEKKIFVNYLDQRVFTLTDPSNAPDSRSAVKMGMNGGSGQNPFPAATDSLTITVQAYGSAILAEKPQ